MKQSVLSASSLTADIFGLFTSRRHRIYPTKIIDNATFDKPFEPPAGIPWVIVNGQVAVKNGEPTKSLTGRALRHSSKLVPSAGG